MGDVARAHDAVIGRARHAQPVERGARHHLARARRVGDEHHRAAALAKAHERVAGIRGRGDPVVDDPPDVAEHDFVAAREGGEVTDVWSEGIGHCGWTTEDATTDSYYHSMRWLVVSPASPAAAG